MRFLLLALSAFAALAAAADNPFKIPIDGYTFSVGKPTTLSWDPTTQGTVTLQLQWGASPISSQGITIASSIANSGSFTWTPSSDLAAQPDYTIRIVNDDDTTDYNFLQHFVVASATGTASATAASTTTSSSSVSTTSASSASSTLITTTASASSTASSSLAVSSSSASASASSTSASANTSTSTSSTSSSSTSSASSAFSTSSSSSSSSSSSTASSTSVPNTQSGGAGVLKVPSVLMGLVMGVMAVL